MRIRTSQTLSDTALIVESKYPTMFLWPDSSFYIPDKQMEIIRTGKHTSIHQEEIKILQNYDRCVSPKFKCIGHCSFYNNPHEKKKIQGRYYKGYMWINQRTQH